jgi:hypothetical protein
MMSGWLDEPAPGSSPRPRVYRVLRRRNGWCVAVNGCTTRPLADREDAVRLARRLQLQWDHLNHAPIRLDARPS